MKRIVILLSGIVAAAIIIIVMGCTENNKPVKAIRSKERMGFVLMELFTSQGCSSCPPADYILGQYALKNDAHIIPLAFHVDYWDRLGWKDSFSTAGFTQRQHEYAAKFNLESVYTPQLIINGRKELVGSNEAAIAETVSDFLNETASVTINVSNKIVEGNTVKIGYIINNNIAHSSINAALVQAKLVTHIRAGENRGLQLNNYNVVRDLTTMHLTNTTGNLILHLPPGSNAAEFSIVLFVQDNDSGKIAGASKTAL